jgi:hypothetical protein
MKTIVIALYIVLVTSTIMPAQTITEMLLPLKPDQKVVLNLKFADTITVQPWNKPTVFIKAEVDINGGELNHAHTMDSAFYSDALEITAGLDEELLSDRSFDDCNESGASQRHFKPNDKEVRKSCIRIRYTVYLPKGTNLELETITGNIKILNMTGIVEAKSVTGMVELMIPSNQHADVYLKSVKGRVYSDLEVKVPEQTLKPLLARKLEGKLNGGGKEVRLESVMGDANIRGSN